MMEQVLLTPGKPFDGNPYNPPAPLPEYAQRLAEETQQTITRLVNLDGYMNTKTYGELTPLKRSLLYQQRQEMEAYAKTVSLRYCMALLEHR